MITHKELFDGNAKDRVESEKYAAPGFFQRLKLYRRHRREVGATKGGIEGTAAEETVLGNEEAEVDAEGALRRRRGWGDMEEGEKIDVSATEKLVGEDKEEGGAPGKKQHEEEEPQQLTLLGALVLLAVVTGLVGVTAEWLVDSIDGLASSTGISKEWIGLILLPIVGNAAEHATAVVVARKDKMTLSIGVAVGSSIVSSFLPLWRDMVN